MCKELKLNWAYLARLLEMWLYWPTNKYCRAPHPKNNIMRGPQYMYVDRPNRYLQYTVYKKGPYSQQCPSGGDEEGLLVIHGINSAWEIENNLNE